jgi:hypothetical protein
MRSCLQPAATADAVNWSQACTTIHYNTSPYTATNQVVAKSLQIVEEVEMIHNFLEENRLHHNVIILERPNYHIIIIRLISQSYIAKLQDYKALQYWVIHLSTTYISGNAHRTASESA